MTKKNMIQEIQNQEAQLYFSYMQAAKLWGREDALTIRLQTKMVWCISIDGSIRHTTRQYASRQSSSLEIRFALPEAS
jgi:hypothetical protein